MSAPRLSSLSGRTVVIEWNPPSVPNGVILKYVIQRRVVGDGNPSDVAEVNASLPLRYEDNTAQPVTNYQYRVIAYNSGPGEPSPYGNITTGEGGMEANEIKHKCLLHILFESCSRRLLGCCVLYKSVVIRLLKNLSP